MLCSKDKIPTYQLKFAPLSSASYLPSFSSSRDKNGEKHGKMLEATESFIFSLTFIPGKKKKKNGSA